MSGLRIATLVLTDKAPAYLAENFTPHLIPHTKLARQHIEQPSKRSSAVVDDTSNRKYLAALQALEEISKLNIPTITIEKVEACINDNHYQEVALQERKFRFLSLDDVVICNINLFRADLRQATIHKSLFSGKFREIDLRGANISDTRFQVNSDIFKAKLSKSTIDRMIANKVNFFAADFSGSTFSATDAKQNFGSLIATIDQEPVTIQKTNKDVAVVVSIARAC